MIQVAIIPKVMSKIVGFWSMKTQHKPTIDPIKFDFTLSFVKRLAPLPSGEITKIIDNKTQNKSYFG